MNIGHKWVKEEIPGTYILLITLAIPQQNTMEVF